MNSNQASRRTVIKTGVSALTASATLAPIKRANADGALSRRNEDTIRRYYAAWETKDWSSIDVLLADDFTFTSANNDDHIDKSVFKTRCWEAQKDFVERFDLLRVFGRGNEAIVMYLGRTKNHKTFRNVEYVRLRHDQLEAIECYFGAQSSFPSAASGTPG